VLQKAQRSALDVAFLNAPVHAARVPTLEHASIRVAKLDDEEQLVFGEVYAPAPPDSQGDFMVRQEIKKMAYEFLRKGFVGNIDVQHTREDTGCYVVESFIARDGDPIFIPGAWVLGVKVPDPAIWSLVKSGELNGFSLDGSGVRVDRVIELELPDEIEGETEEAQSHRHTFVVRYDNAGNFLGGETTGPFGHQHRIVKGTATEPAQGHSHRFSFIHGVFNAAGSAQGD
jgi:hypothetical protein